MRKCDRKRLALLLPFAFIMVLMAGCGQESTRESAGNSEVEAAENVSEAQDAEGKQEKIREEDSLTEWDADTATGLVLTENGIAVEGPGAEASGSMAVIRKGGTYVASGSLENGQIRVEAGDDAVVHLVLNGVNLSNETTAPIYGADKSKVILTLEDGTKNMISDGEMYQYENENEDEPDSPIFVKGDLTINGNGTLEVSGNYQSGVRSKGELRVMSGTITIDAQDDGLKGKDCVIIRDGDLSIHSVKDGIKSNHENDPERGYIWIEGGNLRIMARDDGIQAETGLVIRGGDVEIIESQEGLAGKTVDILGGVIHVTARDDGINSAASVETEREKMVNQEGVYTRIAGGEIWLNARADGIDSNGDLYIEGGELYLTGPNSGGDGILDYNGQAVITGGTVFAAGGSGMMQTFGEASTQPVLVVYYPEMKQSGTEVSLADADGVELAKYAPEREFDTVIISSPDVQKGNVYYVTAGEDRVEMTVDSMETVSGEPSGRGEMDGRGKLNGRDKMDDRGKLNGRDKMDGRDKLDGRGEMDSRGKLDDRSDKGGHGGEGRPEGMRQPEKMEPSEGMERPEEMELPEGRKRPEGTE